MTKVLLLMWLADVVGNLDVVLTLFLIAALLTLVIFGLTCLFTEDSKPYERHQNTIKLIACVALGFALVASLLPSKTTVRLAAAAVAGDTALSTATGTKAMEAIDAVLDRIKREAAK